jgi:hypothetical protein
VPRIAPDRGKQHLHGLLGNGFSAIVGSERFGRKGSGGDPIADPQCDVVEQSA